MNGIPRQNVVLVLGELQEDPRYQALVDPALDAHSNEFRQAVQTVERLCLQVQPREAPAEEILERLTRLREACVGDLAPFRAFIERAVNALG